MTDKDELVWWVDEHGELIKIPKSQIPKETQTRIHFTPNAKPQKRPPEGWECGTWQGYFNKKCRCIPCKDAGTAYSRAKREYYRENPRQDITHGTTSGYSYFGCRCRPCTDAMLAHVRSYPPSEKARQSRLRRNKGYRQKQLAKMTPEEHEQRKEKDRIRSRRKREKAKALKNAQP